MGLFPARVALVARTQSWSFHIVRDHRFRPGCWSCSCMEGDMIRICHLVVPGCRLLYELGFHTVQGAIDAGGHVFVPSVFWSCTCMQGFMMWG